MITAQAIRDSIKNQLVGKDYTWSWEWDAHEAFNNFLKAQGMSAQEKHFSLSSNRGERQTARLYYKGKEIGYVDIKKQQGNKHHSWLGGSYCDWTIKDVNVMLYQDDLNKSMEVAEQRIVADIAAKNAKEQAALKLYKLILANCKDKYEAHDLIDYIKSHRYTLEDKLEEE